ncbi:MAG: hypothetical protein ACP5JB_06910 [candidate division WOR-3 bacterium]
MPITTFWTIVQLHAGEGYQETPGTYSIRLKTAEITVSTKVVRLNN